MNPFGNMAEGKDPSANKGIHPKCCSREDFSSAVDVSRDVRDVICTEQNEDRKTEGLYLSSDRT